MAVEAAKLIATVGADIGGFEREMGRADGILGNFASAGKMALVGATAAMGAALAGFGAKAVSTASDFEAQMNILGVSARNSGTELDDLRQASIAVGADTQLVGISASEAADAITNLYKAGMDTSQIFGDLQGYLSGTTELGGALRSAIDLAAASELELSDTSRLVAVSMATFGLGAEDAASIANQFVGAADASVTSVGALAEALENVGPTVASYGWSLDEANTALALLSSRGIEGAEAGNALKSMMTNMTSPTKAVQAAWAELGTSMYDAQGQVRPLRDIIADLQEAMKGMNDQQRLTYIQTLASTYGQKALNSLLSEGVEGWDEMSAAMGEAATAQEVATARTQGFKAAQEQLKGSLEALLINVGTPLIENVLTPGVKLLGEWIGDLAEMVPTSDQVTAALTSAKNTIAAVGAEIKTFLADPLGYVRENWPTWQTTIATAFNNAITGAVGWIGENIAPVATNLWTHLVTIVSSAASNLVTNGATYITQVGQAIGSIITGAATWLVTNVGPYVESLWGSFKSWISGAVSSIVTNGPTWAAEIGGAIGSLWSGAVAWLGENVGPYIESLWGSIKSWVSGAISTISTNGPTWAADIGGEIGSLWSGAVDWLQNNALPYVTKLWEGYKEIIGKALDLFIENSETLGRNWGVVLGTVIRKAVEILVKGAVGLATLLWDAISTIWLGGAADEGDAGTGGTRIAEMAKALVRFFGGMFDGLITGLTGDAQWSEKLSKAVDGIVTNALDSLKELPKKFVDFGKGLIDGMIKGIEAKAEDLVDAIKRSVTDKLPAFVKNALGIESPSTVFASIGADVMRGMQLGMEREAYRPARAAAVATSSVTNAPTYNLTATYGGAPSSDMMVLLQQLVAEVRRQRSYGPLPDMVMP